MNLAQLIDPATTTSVYVHFPYCAVRCRYCDFNVARKIRIPRDEYTAAVLAEGRLRAPAFAHRRLLSVYFGGGTPSLWGAEHVGRVIEAIGGWFPNRHEDLEITLEMNPSEATELELAAYRAAGVTRLSLGLQSLSDDGLRQLNRAHTAEMGLDAVKRSLTAGFQSVSADLIFGLPGLTTDVWRHTLATVAGLGVPHLSIYHLTVEPRTGLERAVSRRELTLPGEDEEVAQWEAILPTLTPLGVGRYEISNYARPGHESRHNTSYWLGQSYLGLGAGAHSFDRPASWRDGASGVRRENTRPHGEYIAKASAGVDPESWRETIDRDTHERERLFTGLRYAPGLSLDALSDELGLDVETRYAAVFTRLEADGLMTRKLGKVALTERGVTLGDTVAARIFDAKPR